ncbi:MAG: transposase [Bacteroidales bacterium]
MDELDFLFNECHPAFSSHSSWTKCRELMYGSLTCLGRRTVTGMLAASGNQFVDWSGAYRLFSQQRVDVSKILNVVQSNVLQETSSFPHIIAHMDDTIIKKTGKRIPGTAWRRDPLGPPFYTNFIWGQRFIQMSLALPRNGQTCQSRAIPIDFHHCPTVAKPRKTADKEQWDTYREEKKIAKLSRQGAERIKLLRNRLDDQKYNQKELVIGVDGSYTNKEVLKNLPHNTTLIGRIRKDTKLYTIPDKQTGSGRKRVYGERLPTPEQIRQSSQCPWQQVQAWAAGKVHKFDVKIIHDIRWRSAGPQNLALIVIRPLGYRLTKNARVLYRDPAYLICTQTKMNIKDILQAYLWRWEIEVDFREEKTLLGCGQAQVRNQNSVESIPSFIVAVYGLLHLANYRANKLSKMELLPRPKWYPLKKQKRITTGDLLNNLRAQIWAKANKLNFSHFVNNETNTRSLRNESNSPISAFFYLRN